MQDKKVERFINTLDQEGFEDLISYFKRRNFEYCSAIKFSNLVLIQTAIRDIENISLEVFSEIARSTRRPANTIYYPYQGVQLKNREVENEINFKGEYLFARLGWDIKNIKIAWSSPITITKIDGNISYTADVWENRYNKRTITSKSITKKFISKYLFQWTSFPLSE